MQDNWKFEPGLAFNDLVISQQAGRRSLQRRWIIPSLLMHCIAYSIAGDTVIPVCTDWISHFDQRRFHTLIATLALKFKLKYRTIESLKQDLDLMTWSFHSRAVVLKSGGLSLSCWCIALFIRLLLIQWYKWYKYDTVIPICTDWISTNDLKGGFTLAIALIHIYLALPLQFLSAPQSDSYWHHRAVLLMAD